MGQIRIQLGRGDAVERPLAATTLLGRHPTCLWPVDHPRVPLYWVELRWTRSGWGWRALAEAESTRGPHALLPGSTEWRRLVAGDTVQVATVRLTLVDDTVPEAFAVELGAGAPLPLVGDALDTVVERRADGDWPVDAEGRPELVGPLQDGDTFTCLGRVLRYRAGESPTATRRTPLSLLRRGCELYLDPGPRLTIVENEAEQEFSGAYVRALLPYARARAEDRPAGGWLSLDAAWAGWRAAGGTADSGRERVAQDRSRLVRALGRRGIGGAPELFETRREAGSWQTRLALSPDRVFLDLDEPAEAAVEHDVSS